MRCRFAVGLAVTVVLASSCTGESGRTVPADESSPPTTRGPAAQDTDESVDCDFDRRVVEVAAAVYSLTYQRDASSIDDLAEFGVADETARWTLQVPTDDDTGSTVAAPLPDGPCAR